MHAPPAFPDWFTALAVKDRAFARAYESLPAARRAWIKTCIARLYDWTRPSGVSDSVQTLAWESGASTMRRTSPRELVLVAFDRDYGSFARIAAALVPALTSGAANLAAVRVGGGGPMSDEVLTLFELAGVELVCQAGPRQFGRLLGDIGPGREGCLVLALGRTVQNLVREPQGALGFAVWNAPALPEAGVWLDGPGDFDLAALAFAQPDADFRIMGADPGPLGGRFRRLPGGFEDFLGLGLDVAYAPSARLERVLENCGLAFGPGQECCWVWPGLCPASFLVERIGWGLAWPRVRGGP
ncbi:MAG: hypothetical protein JW718_08055 [Desulfovibrionaceae bacterium]|nr:hypothetical protein [Desulfovibrionaceae bacterium]